jgi:hypothetical protein
VDLATITFGGADAAERLDAAERSSRGPLTQRALGLGVQKLPEDS